MRYVDKAFLEQEDEEDRSPRSPPSSRLRSSSLHPRSPATPVDDLAGLQLQDQRDGEGHRGSHSEPLVRASAAGWRTSWSQQDEGRTSSTSAASRRSRSPPGQGRKLGAFLDDARPVPVQGRRPDPRVLHGQSRGSAARELERMTAWRPPARRWWRSPRVRADWAAAERRSTGAGDGLAPTITSRERWSGSAPLLAVPAHARLDVRVVRLDAADRRLDGLRSRTSAPRSTRSTRDRQAALDTTSSRRRTTARTESR